MADRPEHEGVAPLGDAAEAQAAAARAVDLLAAAGRDPPGGMAIAAGLEVETDRYWPEALAAALASEGGPAGADGESLAAAFTVAMELRGEATAQRIRPLNTRPKLDAASETQTLVATLLWAAPETRTAFVRGELSNDELFMRRALAHFFRCDPMAEWEIARVDAAVWRLPDMLGTTVHDCVCRILERFADSEVPEGTWGFLGILEGDEGRSGRGLPAPEDGFRDLLRHLRANSAGPIGVDPDSPETLHAAVATAWSGFHARGDDARFVGLMAAICEARGSAYMVLWIRADGGGVATSMTPIPAGSAAEARRVFPEMAEAKEFDAARNAAERGARRARAARQRSG